MSAPTRKRMQIAMAYCMKWIGHERIASTSGADGSIYLRDLRAIRVLVHFVYHAARWKNFNVLYNCAARLTKNTIVYVGSDSKVVLLEQ